MKNKLPSEQPMSPKMPDNLPPKCPQCSGPLKPITYEGGYLNREQWDDVRAGDWLCESCPDNGRSNGKTCCFWDREVIRPAVPAQGGEIIQNTLGRANALSAEGKPDSALDVMHSALDGLMKDGDLTSIQAILDAADPATMDLDICIAVLSCTTPVKSGLVRRERLWKGISDILIRQSESYADVQRMCGIEDAQPPAADSLRHSLHSMEPYKARLIHPDYEQDDPPIVTVYPAQETDYEGHLAIVWDDGTEDLSDPQFLERIDQPADSLRDTPRADEIERELSDSPVNIETACKILMDRYRTLERELAEASRERDEYRAWLKVANETNKRRREKYEAAKQDSERLEWLLANHMVAHPSEFASSLTTRDEIDAAMEGGEG